MNRANELQCACCSAAAAEAPEDEERPPPVEFQPESVVGEMREYQLEGLKWLVARFDDGINTILADEMVCLRPRTPTVVVTGHSEHTQTPFLAARQ